MRLALDAAGGDHAPTAPVTGALAFARAHPEHALVLVGDEAELRPLLGRAPPNVRLQHASEVVRTADAPVAAIRRQRDSSLRVCFELARAGEADAVISAGSSGAVMAGALLVLGRIAGVERPAIAALLPALRGGGRCLLLDAGANAECRAVHLGQFAVMGTAYLQVVQGVASPRVGLLSNGEEDEKGTALTREALALLRASPLAFHGYVEGKDIFTGDVDVVVTDGFTGNVVLKATEGTAMAVASLLRNAVRRAGLSEKLGAMMLGPTFKGLRRVTDYAEYGGAPLLGVDGTVVVAHGRSNPRAIQQALATALHHCEVGLPGALKDALAQAARWLPARKEPPPVTAG